MTEEKQLIDEVKSVLNAIDAIKSGKPTETKSEEVVEETVETPVEETVEEATEEVAKSEEVKTEEVVEETEVSEEVEAEEKTEEVVEQKEVKTEEVKSIDVEQFNQLIEAVKIIGQHVADVTEEVKTLKASRMARKGVMPEEKVEVEVPSEVSRLKKEADYIFGKK